MLNTHISNYLYIILYKKCLHNYYNLKFFPKHFFLEYIIVCPPTPKTPILSQIPNFDHMPLQFSYHSQNYLQSFKNKNGPQKGTTEQIFN